MSSEKPTKRGRGRPPEATPGSVSVSIRLEPSELDQVDAIAGALVPGVRLARHEAARAAFVRGLQSMTAESKG